MKKSEFIYILRRKLTAMNVADVEDIVLEYEQHFQNKIADGYSEEEIVTRLGDPDELASQFDTTDRNFGKTKYCHALIVGGLVIVAIIVFLLFFLLFCWVVILGAFSLACAAVGTCLVFQFRGFGLMPAMPYESAIIFAVSMLALAVLAAVGTIYFYLFMCQLFSAFSRWFKNALAYAGGRPLLPPLPVQPQMRPKFRRRLRTVRLVSLTVFTTSFVLGIIVSAVIAGELGFWHVWNWFVK